MSFLDRLLLEPHPWPIVVLGNQRSGTSAVAHLLADGCGLSRTIDIPQLWWPELALLLGGRRTLEHVVRRHPRPFSRELIKEPNLTFFFPELLRLFPAARYVFVLRDPRDNLRSLLERIEVPGDLDRLEPKAWRIPVTWAHLFDREAWRLTGDSYIDLLAERWCRAAGVYLEHREKMVLVRYEDFVAEKAGEIAALAQRLGYRLTRDISDRVDVPYQPPGSHGVNWREFFGERNLLRIERLCGNRMVELGYEASSCPS